MSHFTDPFCHICGQQLCTVEDPCGMNHGEGRCRRSDGEQYPPDHARFQWQLQLATHFIVDLGFDQHPRAVITLRTLREVITDLLRLHEPDTLSVRLTTGDRPLDTSQQATALVIETSSKTGNSFDVAPADLQFSIDNAAVASVSANGDGTATVTPVAVGTATLTVKDTKNGLVGTIGVTVTAVVPDAPDTLTVTLSPPFPFGTSGNAPKTAASGAKPV